ncbi:neutral amino acid transporter [Podila epigama]|nr:neutral amino acid transporter [Podila epigama]
MSALDQHQQVEVTLPEPPKVDRLALSMVSSHSHQSQDSHNTTEIATTDATSATHKRNISFPASQTTSDISQQQQQQQQQHQRGRSSFLPGSRSNNTIRNQSKARSRPNSRSQSTNRNNNNNDNSDYSNNNNSGNGGGSKPGSRPVSWLVRANSDYTSMYEHFGGTGSRSRRASLIEEDSISNAEKGGNASVKRNGLSSLASSFIGGSPGGHLAHPYEHTLIREDSVESKQLSSSEEDRTSKGRLLAPQGIRRYWRILFSCLTLWFVAMICFVAFLLLVKVRLLIRESFQDIGLVLYGKWMRLAVLAAVVLSQIGFVCAYLIFISQNLDAVVQTFTRCKFTGIAQKYYILIPLVVLVPLVLIRRMSLLSVPSMFANLFIIFGIIYLWYFSIDSLAHHGAGPDLALFNKDDFALLIGTAVFTYEGIGLVIPITESMDKPEKFPRVLALTMMIVTIIFTSVGALCYAAFGSHVETIVLLNLPIQGGMTVTVEILYSLAIILSIPLQLSPVSRIFEYGVFGTRSGGSEPKVKMQKNLLRSLLICFCAVLSFLIGGPNLDKFVAFVGSVACMPLCFIFPALFHYRACAKTVKDKVLDVLLGVLGIAAMVFTLYITIRSWVVTTAPEPELSRCAAFAV